jgi:hypothetical protein
MKTNVAAVSSEKGVVMRLTGPVVVAACLLLGPATAGAADLSKVDRTITKEPAYRFKPKYCLLVFGPEAKQRVWLVLDGDTLYVDKNGNGDLTETGECFQAPTFKVSEHPAHARERSIQVGDLKVGGLTHSGLAVSQIEYHRKVDVSRGTGASTPQEWQEYLDSIWRQVPDGIIYDVSINLNPKCYGLFDKVKGRHVLHFAWIDQQGQLAFSDQAKTAPIVHFGGPLTLRVSPSEKLCIGEQPGRITLCLGTPGLGPGAFATMSYDLVPSAVHPVVEVHFPVKKPGQKALTRKYVLEQRC